VPPRPADGAKAQRKGPYLGEFAAQSIPVGPRRALERKLQVAQRVAKQEKQRLYFDMRRFDLDDDGWLSGAGVDLDTEAPTIAQRSLAVPRPIFAPAADAENGGLRYSAEADGGAFLGPTAQQVRNSHEMGAEHAPVELLHAIPEVAHAGAFYHRAHGDDVHEADAYSADFLPPPRQIPSGAARTSIEARRVGGAVDVERLSKWLSFVGVRCRANLSYEAVALSEWCDGVKLCKLIGTLEHRVLDGVTRAPKSSAAKLYNVNKALKEMRGMHRVKAEHLWDSAGWLRGDPKMVIETLEALRLAFKNHQGRDGLEHESKVRS